MQITSNRNTTRTARPIKLTESTVFNPMLEPVVLEHSARAPKHPRHRAAIMAWNKMTFNFSVKIKRTILKAKSGKYQGVFEVKS